MDRGDDELIGWSIDTVAAGLLAAAAGACLLLLGMPLQGVIASAAIGVAALAGLRQVRPEPRRFRVRTFALPPAPFEEGATEVLELTSIFQAEPLELVDALPEPPSDSRVVQLFASRPLPTPGELALRIEHHLGGSERDRLEGRDGDVIDLGVDASAALRQALGELRRSLA